MIKLIHLMSALFFLILGMSCSSSDQGGMNQEVGVTEQISDSLQIDREYFLEASILGYQGVGGIYNGVRNPVLQAEQGEVVRITIVNAELMPHDIVMELHGVASDIIVEEGDSASVVFTALQSDTYFCSIPGHREGGMEGQFEVVESVGGQLADEGMSPQIQGRPMNSDFENGTVTDWTAIGEAFAGQPIRRDPSPMHNSDMTIGHMGDYFVSSGGSINAAATGTLVSDPFEVTHPFASFRISGGALQETRVEIADAETGEVLFRITGNNHATLRPVIVDLSEKMGDEIIIRIIDNETGLSQIPYISDDIWAHINMDDFRFHDSRPIYLNELRPEDIISLPPRDVVAHAGLSGEDAAASMTTQEGFSIELAASEPDVVRPIALAMDERGRLWVAEGHTYPERAPEGDGQDRILIFEDTNGDGKLDNRTVFYEGLNLVSGLEVGFGGVWVGAAPYMLFIPIDETGDAPAGEPEILLDGFGYQDTHETLNSFKWGPDGWLYGAHGVFTHSIVGRPGTPEEDRIRLNAGIWRYHPVRDQFEVFAHGTSNPWGVDFNDVGHAFATACVIPHLFHIVQGGRYDRQSGQHFNAHTYDDIQTIADHVHWVGDRGPHAGNFRSDEAGGGHAHAGAMFYLGSEHWQQSRDAIFMNNIHGYRVNVDQVVRSGSGYTASHGEDFLLTNDSWSQWLDFEYGPSGSVYTIDWYDKNQCHSPNPDVHEKTLGRIFKLSHELDEWTKIDLAQLESLELVEMQLQTNDWYVRHARKLLQERGPNTDVHRALFQILYQNPDVSRKLRAIWALHVTGGLNDQNLIELLSHENEYIRGWAITLLAEDKSVPSAAMSQFAGMARNDDSAIVRLNLASVLQRVDPVDRWDILEGLYSRQEDSDDHNLPLMIWYAAEPTVELNMERAMLLAMESELPELLQYTVRRIGEIGTSEAERILQDSMERLGESNHHNEMRHIIEQMISES